MAKKLLITFGCSWTYGVGAAYQSDMPTDNYIKLAWDPDLCFEYSFRNLLCREFNLENKNFSEGGSSNQRQFRYAKEYFGSDTFQNDLDKFDQIIVLHAITDTGRNEYYDLSEKEIVNVQYANVIDKKTIQKKFAEFMVKYSYDHETELDQLITEFRFWNTFYKKFNIKNIWLDTFNHHQYNCSVPNFLGNDLPKRDLMSQLARRNGLADIDDGYHISAWKIDCDRVNFLIKKEILNPISMHPTQKGHKEICEILGEYFVKNNIIT